MTTYTENHSPATIASCRPAQSIAVSDRDVVNPRDRSLSGQTHHPAQPIYFTDSAASKFTTGDRHHLSRCTQYVPNKWPSPFWSARSAHKLARVLQRVTNNLHFIERFHVDYGQNASQRMEPSGLALQLSETAGKSGSVGSNSCTPTGLSVLWNNRAKKNIVNVRRVMARGINGEFSSNGLLMQSPEHDGRQESRSDIDIPVIIVEFPDDAQAQPSIKTGITQDLSCAGLGVITDGPLPTRDLIVGIGPFDNWSVLQCRSLRTRSIGYGYLNTGLSFERVLPAQEFEAVMEYAQTLEEFALHAQH